MHRQPIWIEAFVVRHGGGVGVARMRASSKQRGGKLIYTYDSQVSSPGGAIECFQRTRAAVAEVREASPEMV
jgi:hypothetical protein